MKVHFLDLGNIEYDEGWALAAAGMSSPSNPNPPSPRRKIAIIATLIDHPTAGPILFDTGAAPAFKELWPAPVQEAFAITRFEGLDAAVGAAGYALSDIRGVVLSHLHLDHAGGLEMFRGTDVPIYVHADELRNAFYAVATKEDLGPYVPHYIDPSFNWQALHADTVELFSGCTLHLLPGHTYALYGLRLDLSNAGTFFLTSDQFHLRDNWEAPHPLGWLLRDHAAWWRSYRFTKTLVTLHNARLLFGHDADVLAELRKEPFYD
jgi:glyoxylase-like metal-dependent hydrolase (beta-lactamase superfamily II)